MVDGYKVYVLKHFSKKTLHLVQVLLFDRLNGFLGLLLIAFLFSAYCAADTVVAAMDAVVFWTVPKCFYNRAVVLPAATMAKLYLHDCFVYTEPRITDRCCVVDCVCLRSHNQFWSIWLCIYNIVYFISATD